MPIHDWSQVYAGLFHHFHLHWIGKLCDALNGGILPPEYYAMGEQIAGVGGPDVLALHAGPWRLPGKDSPLPLNSSQPALQGQMVVAELPVVRTIESLNEEAVYARRQNTITVRHVSEHRMVAMIEILSRGNKSSDAALRQIVMKLSAAITSGCHILAIDLQPPTSRDPDGIHALIWEQLGGQTYHAPRDKPLTLASYDASSTPVAYVEPLASGDLLSIMPLFLEAGIHVNIPLETSYMQVYDQLPSPLKDVINF